MTYNVFSGTLNPTQSVNQTSARTPTRFHLWPHIYTPLPSNGHHRSSGDCLEGKRENYQVCSVQYCVQQLYTVNCTHMNIEQT